MERIDNIESIPVFGMIAISLQYRVRLPTIAVKIVVIS